MKIESMLNGVLYKDLKTGLLKNRLKKEEASVETQLIHLEKEIDSKGGLGINLIDKFDGFEPEIRFDYKDLPEVLIKKIEMFYL